eukprot:11189459-Alexandrium_andersonii.AAC.1
MACITCVLTERWPYLTVFSLVEVLPPGCADSSASLTSSPQARRSPKLLHVVSGRSDVSATGADCRGASQ